MVKLFEHKKRKDIILKDGRAQYTTFRIPKDIKYKCLIIALKRDVEMSCYMRDSIIKHNERYKYFLDQEVPKGRRRIPKEFLKHQPKRFLIAMLKETHRQAKHISLCRGMTLTRYIIEAINKQLSEDIKNLGLTHDLGQGN